MKKCSKCGIKKPLNDFFLCKRTKSGRYPSCKSCESERSRRWHEKNTEKIREYARKARQKDPEKHREISRNYSKMHPEKCREIKRRRDKRLRSDPKHRLNCRMKNAIAVSLKGNKNGRSWVSLVGYTIEELKKHLEKQFLLGMSWDNRGDWHIDHKIPISAFNFNKPEDIDFKSRRQTDSCVSANFSQIRFLVFSSFRRKRNSDQAVSKSGSFAYDSFNVFNVPQI